jgi:hypothetical protein
METDVASLLAEDVQANFATIQLVVLGVSILIAVTGAILAARASAYLGEARELYARAHQLEKALAVFGAKPLSAMSNQRQTTRKIPTRRTRNIVE